MHAPASPTHPPRHCKIAIIGTGFSGLGMAIRLQQKGEQDFLLFEKDAGVGGTWRVNSYPGCACDVQSHLYSFSFEPNPNWARRFAPQAEIKGYLEACWGKYQLQDKTLLNRAVTQLRWDAEHLLWLISTADGEHFSAQFVVTGTGALSTAAIPKVAGIEHFKGPVFHSQQWNHDYDLNGKRVAVIGTGASAIQFVPHLQKQVAQLDLYQRTAPWIMPKPDRQFSAREQQRLQRWPWLQKFWRGLIYAALESSVIGFAWAPKIMHLAELVSKRHLKKSIQDPALRAILTPNYRMGCKRVLISNDYYPALAQANVSVISDGIREVRANSIVTRDGQEREVEAIIFGTGFTASDPLPRNVLFGQDGIELLDSWPEGPQAYKGTMTAGFPNLFFLMGPNTGLGHNSVIYMIESQIHYILGALSLLKEGNLDSLEPKREVQLAFNRTLQSRLAHTVWSVGGCTSWYLHPLSGRNNLLWPGFTWRFRMITRTFDPAAYHFSRRHPNQAELNAALSSAPADEALT